MLNQLNKKKTIEIILLVSLVIITFDSLIYFFEKYIQGDRYIFLIYH